MRVILESPNADLKWLREWYWNPSKQKAHLEEEGKKKILCCLLVDERIFFKVCLLYYHLRM